MNEADLRVQRTRRRLRDAFIALVIARGYEAVTVLDIVAQAKVGHKTFYRHYNDKEAMLNAMLEEILLEAQPFLLPPDTPQAPAENTLNALRFAQKYANLWRVLLRSPAAESLLQPLLAFAQAEGKRFFGGSQVPDDLVAYHFATGMMSLLRWWLEQGMPYPPEEMAMYIDRLLLQPIQGLGSETK
jgi:AcrR family transcriptional regulator